MARRYRRRRKNHDEGLILLILVLIGLGWSENSGASQTTFDLVAAIVLLLVAVIAGIVFYQKYRQTKRLQQLTIDQVDTMDGLEFEKYVAVLLKKQGYQNIRLTEKYDYGIDIIATKDGIKWGIQVKRYKGLVKAAAVRQVIPALKKYHCDRAMVVTNSTFSRVAKELARTNDCILIDRPMLAAWVSTK